MNNKIAKRRLQRCRFLLMGISCALLLIGLFNTQSVAKYHTTTTVLGAFTTAKKEEKPLYDNYADKQTYYKDLKAYYSTLSKKELRKELHHQLKELKDASSVAGTVAIVFIIIILTSIALYLIAGLACSLSCNGQHGLALLVLIGGMTATIGLAVLLVRAFKKREKKRKAAEEKPTIKPPETNSAS